MKDTGASKRLKELFKKIRSESPEMLQIAGEELCLIAAEHAPDKQTEYNVMMTGSGNPEGITNYPAFPSANINAEDEILKNGASRMRFYKPDGYWLQEIVAKSMVVDKKSLTVSLGEIAVLKETSVYYWRNITGEIYSNHFPFWQCWEDGMRGSFLIMHAKEGSHGAYTLKPGIGKANARWFMFKSIPGFHFYATTAQHVPELIENSIKPAIRKMAQAA